MLLLAGPGSSPAVNFLSCPATSESLHPSPVIEEKGGRCGVPALLQEDKTDHCRQTPPPCVGARIKTELSVSILHHLLLLLPLHLLTPSAAPPAVHWCGAAASTPARQPGRLHVSVRGGAEVGMQKDADFSSSLGGLLDSELSKRRSRRTTTRMKAPWRRPVSIRSLSIPASS